MIRRRVSMHTYAVMARGLARIICIPNEAQYSSLTPVDMIPNLRMLVRVTYTSHLNHSRMNIFK